LCIMPLMVPTMRSTKHIRNFFKVPCLKLYRFLQYTSHLKTLLSFLSFKDGVLQLGGWARDLFLTVQNLLVMICWAGHCNCALSCTQSWTFRFHKRWNLLTSWVAISFSRILLYRIILPLLLQYLTNGEDLISSWYITLKSTVMIPPIILSMYRVYLKIRMLNKFCM
jgi:hypothetical protein